MQIKKTPSEQEKKLNTFIKDSRNLLKIAFSNYYIWNLYKSEEKDYSDILRRYEGFFIQSRYAHFIAMLLAITSLLDKDSHKYNSIFSYITYIKINELLNDDSVEEIDQKIFNLQPFVSKLMFLRSNIYAHISPNINPDVAHEKKGLTDNDYMKVIQLIGDIIEIIERDLIKSKFFYWIDSGSKDLKNILDALKNLDS